MSANLAVVPDAPKSSTAVNAGLSEGVQLDYDADGNLVDIDIDNASAKVQLKELS